MDISWINCFYRVFIPYTYGGRVVKLITDNAKWNYIGHKKFSTSEYPSLDDKQSIKVLKSINKIISPPAYMTLSAIKTTKKTPKSHLENKNTHKSIKFL